MYHSTSFKLERKTSGAAAWDIKSAEDYVLKRGINKIKTGIKIQIPEGYYGQILGRSSLAVAGISVVGGVIDSDYRGEILVLLQALEDGFKINSGDRIAQLALIKIYEGELKEVDNPEILSNTDRGSGGFGSTGTR